MRGRSGKYPLFLGFGSLRNGKIVEEEEEEEEQEGKKLGSLDHPRKAPTHLNPIQRGQEQRPPYIPYPPSSSDHARLSERTFETHSPERRLRGLRTPADCGGGGGGRIVRATGRKDRHSKVCTAKGLRDRRVRLSAQTAIQFYDVQDRLGFDRPSKAVDWLIKNAKPAIDQLAELPQWLPAAETPYAAAAEVAGEESLHGGGSGDPSNFFRFTSLDSDSIADTLKSFYPIAAAASSSGASVGYDVYSSAPAHLSHGVDGNVAAASGRGGDLRLSLQSFQDPVFYHQQSRTTSAQQAFFTFDGGTSAGAGGSLYGWPPQLVQNQFFTQWGPLQSSNPPSIRAWADPTALAAASGDQMQMAEFRSSSTSPVPITGDFVGFSGYHYPARSQGGEEHGRGAGDDPPTASSALHH